MCVAVGSEQYVEDWLREERWTRERRRNWPVAWRALKLLQTVYLRSAATFKSTSPHSILCGTSSRCWESCAAWQITQQTARGETRSNFETLAVDEKLVHSWVLWWVWCKYCHYFNFLFFCAGCWRHVSGCRFVGSRWCHVWISRCVSTTRHLRQHRRCPVRWSHHVLKYVLVCVCNTKCSGVQFCIILPQVPFKKTFC